MGGPVKRGIGQHHGDLRNALLEAALELVTERGPRGLTMAEAARRARVSVAAPYKHFAERDALLAALAVQGYQEQERRFRAALGRAPGSAAEQLAELAAAYLGFAVECRALFEVVFGAGLDKAEWPEVAEAAGRVVELLTVPAAVLDPGRADELMFDVAGLAHGLAVFLLEGTFGPPADALVRTQQRVRAAVLAMLRPAG